MPIRFAALGDSITEGVGDPGPNGWRGWAALLAPTLADEPVEFHNLARSGALSGDLPTQQLPAAIALRPRYAAIVIGGNDTLRAGFDIGRTAQDLDTTMRSLHADGTILLTACLPDPGRLLRLPRPFADPLARRIDAVNTVVHALSTRYRTVHLHLADLPWQTERSLLSVDRLHPSPTGHRLIARNFHDLLASSGHSLGPAPATDSPAPAPSCTADIWWMATRGTRWIAARCTDLLPGLLRLAAAESHHRLRGTTIRLDIQSSRATNLALASLPRQAEKAGFEPARAFTPDQSQSPDPR